MKKLLLSIVLLFAATLSMNAQFEKGKKYVGASLSGISMSYNSDQGFHFGLDASGGYFVADCLLLRGIVGYQHTDQINNVSIGGNARYYFDQCGVFLGGGAEFVHETESFNDLQIPIEVGYAFFLNRYITLEPSVYYKMSLTDFSDKSTVGLKVGIGIYF